ncbi:tyrosine-type recombinase/integrase [Kribbella capetownensis]|uniref:tyrosine-type recombinase/integrase n=1 Tax=Kribbella capetownensis TaxID=1572659 RepID=UPI00192D4DF0|nr:tyrosine-type recombinase/integrase [Kribbella capetownensis]
MAKVKAKPKRPRGQIETLPSGSLRVSVYAGLDPISKDRVYLRETVPAGPKAEDQAEAVLARFQLEVYERRHPRTDATVDQLLERHFKDAKLGFKTAKNYRSQADKHVIPTIGRVKVRAVDADVMDSFYSELRRCRDHCDRQPRIDHRTNRAHECDERCKAHACEALSESSILYIHQILSGAFRRAVRLKWVTINPIDFAEPPSPPKPRPRPPSVEDAAAIVNEAWKDPDWGALIWLTMVAGNRRGELCGIRWRHVDLNRGVIHVQRAIGQYGKETWEKDTKNEDDRRIVLDPESVAVLSEHRDRCEQRAHGLGAKLARDAFMFSRDPLGETHLKPDSVTQRYSRLVARLGIETSIHKLRTYNATELLSAGVDIRTVAGRHGHGGGGATTGRHYSAWVSEADQRAAGTVTPRMPARPRRADLPPMAEFDPKHPFEKLAAELRDGIYAGTLAVGLPIPSVKEIGRQNGVSPSTAQRAVQLLSDWGLVRVEPGRPTLVAPQPAKNSVSNAEGSSTEAQVASTEIGAETIELEVRRLGVTVASLQTQADPRDAASLHRLLLGAVKRHGSEPHEIDDFELIVRQPGDDAILATYVALSP